MRYWTAGPYQLELDDDGLLNFSADNTRQTFWENVDEMAENVSVACGCYVFTIRRGSSTPKPWYVGKAERQDFKRECLTQDKITKYNTALALSKGTPELWFYGRITAEKWLWSKPTKAGYRDVAYLERMLITQALKVNPNIINKNETALLRSMEVPGMLNTRQGGLRKPDKDLKELFRY